MNAYLKMFMVFNAVFELINCKCNETCEDMRFRPGNLSEREKQSIRTYFLDFADFFTTTANFQQRDWQAREILSGMVLFRLDILPIFLKEIDADDPRIILFLRKMAHFEGTIRAMLSGKVHSQMLINSYEYFKAEGRLSKDIEKEHKWWQDDFDDTEVVNATGDYELTD